MTFVTPEALRKAGLDALRRDLGVVGTVRFLQQFDPGSGDYTAERWEHLDSTESIDALLEAARQHEANRKKS